MRIQVKDIFSPEMISAIQRIQENIDPAILVLAEYQKRLSTIVQELQPAFQQMRENLVAYLNTPEIRRYVSIQQCKTVIHPVYFDFFEADFDRDTIKNNWQKIRSRLYARFPDSLDKDNRKNRYNEILKCQTNGFYIAVCRSIYPEIESLLRDELLLSDPVWKKQWEDQKNGSARTHFQSTQLKKFTKNELENIKLVNDNVSIAEVSPFTMEFILRLEEIFESFDPKDHKDESITSWRHLHAHGWKKEASFIDGLNGLLLFDLALECVAQKKTQLAEKAHELKN